MYNQERSDDVHAGAATVARSKGTAGSPRPRAQAMSSSAIPAWTADGVLPAIDSSQPVSPVRSPYAVSLTDCVLRFTETSARSRVLSGLLEYRSALHRLGLVQGFQWLDGSVFEHVERSEGRDPNDIDVVTFYRLPPGLVQADLVDGVGPLLGEQAKERYLVDGYLVDLGMRPERLVRQSAYWYSVWSHRRNMAWKGFVEVPLAPDDDVAAAELLKSVMGREDRHEPR
jgi:hypothetical protein